MIRIKTRLIALFVVCAMVAHAYGSDIQYNITYLGVLATPPGDQDQVVQSSYATSLNNLGQVVGYADTYTGYSHAFMYTGSGPLVNMGSLAGDYSVSSAQAINNQGMTVGYTDTPGTGNPTHAFVYTTNGGMQDIGTLGGIDSYAWDVNSLGQVVGYASTAHGTTDGFLYSGNGPMVDLGPYQALCINDAAQIAAIVGSGSQSSTYVSSSGTSGWVNIGSLGGTFTTPRAMNNLGEIVGGSAITTANEIAQPFLYNGGTITNLGTFGGQYGWAYGINDSGLVVGGADFAGDLSEAAFVYYGSGSIENLNDLVVNAAPGWTLTEAMAINDSGQIAAEAYQQASGEGQVVLLTPTPEPSSVCLLIIAAVAIAALKTSRLSARVRGFG